MKGKNVTSRNNGIALASVMCAMIIMLLLGWGVLSLGLQGQLFAIQTTSQISARSAADAGLSKALFEMNQKLGRFSFDASVLPQAADEKLPNCDAAYSYSVTGDEDAGFRIESVGTSRNAQKKVAAELRLQGLFDYGLLVVESAILYSGTFVDRYNSGDPSETGIPVQVASINPDPKSIILKPGVVIDGDVLFGVDYEFPEVSPPPLPDMHTDISAKGTTITLGPEHSGQYSSITLSNAGTPTVLEIDGGDVQLCITGDVWMGQGCELRIKPGSSLAIFLDGNWISGNSDGINNETEIPANFKLYGTSQDQTVELKAKDNWYGCIYAPDAELSIKANSDLFGSLVAKTFDNKAKGLIRYDGALSKVKADEIGVHFIIERWYEE